MTQKLPSVPAVVQRVADACDEAGGRAYLVGGGVRDHLRNMPVHDWDIEVFGLSAGPLQRVLRAIGRVNLVGKSFGVFKLTVDGHELDVSIPRRDSKVGPGHTGISVEGDPSMSLREAARRRDLTLNAISFDLTDRVYADPFDGRKDLAERRLRAVDEHTFLEDPLRALRVVQFSARLGFEPVPSLIALCQRASLDELPAERVCAEWGKLLLKGQELVLGMSVAHRAKVVARVFPMVAVGPERGIQLQALLPTRDLEDRLGARWALMLAGWLWLESSATVVATLDRLWVHRVDRYDVRGQVTRLVAHRADSIKTDRDLRHLSTHCELGLLLSIRSAFGEDGVAIARERSSALGILREPPQAWLQGRDLGPLGMPPGPMMGQVLKRVYGAQLDGGVASRPDALSLARAIIDGEK